MKGLLKAMRPFSRSTNVTEFKGQVLAVDVANWLFKGAYIVAEQVSHCCPWFLSFSVTFFLFTNVYLLCSWR